MWKALRIAQIAQGRLPQLGFSKINVKLPPVTCSDFPDSSASFLSHFNFTKRIIFSEGLFGILGEDSIMVLGLFQTIYTHSKSENRINKSLSSLSKLFLYSMSMLYVVVILILYMISCICSLVCALETSKWVRMFSKEVVVFMHVLNFFCAYIHT